ncbi:snRNA-activating protein complex subunit 4 isoform X2 [Rhinatrema bivittatum]|uniref:snRNA-activating protein complex subunit 4 isoform X2 n=1 Tax=Rhinatrema bivittatum TaxID=194408 RepID=UPI001129293E|nr:snRNA-activating protein complex subunit 4 isoform X2 [Rhinatrema bivittatum]
MATVDLNAERREQLQKEIEELEKSLDRGGATPIDVDLSEYSLDSDSGSDDLEDADLDVHFQMDEEMVESNSEDNEDLEKNLPENPETCLQINLVYQEVIEEKIREVEFLIAQNKEQQEEIMWELAGSKVAKSRDEKTFKANIYVGHFLKPYFKDKATGVGPPANEDTREKTAQGIKSFEELVLPKWKAREKTLLKNSVISDSLQHMMQPKLFKLEYLNQKLEKASSAVEKRIVEKQIKETEQEVEDMNLVSEDVLVGKRTDEHDWEKIANINFEGTRKPVQIRKFWQNSEHPVINKKLWSDDEVEKLKETAVEHNCIDWKTIAEKLGTNRTAFQCLQKYQSYNKDFKRKEWTKEEDHMLIQLVQEMRVGNYIPYKKMAYYMEGRDSMQLLHRWTKSVNPSLKKGYWTPEEDALLLKAVAKFGERDWYKIRTEVPGRSDSQCRDRYLKSINQRLKKGKWSPEEEAKFVELVEKYGVGHWTKIASELPGRTDCQCLSKWKSMIGYKKKSQLVKRRKKRRRWEKPSSSSSESISSSEDSDEMVLENSSEDEVETRKKPRKARFVVPSMDLWVPTKATSAKLQKAPARHVPNRPLAQGSAESTSGSPSTAASLETSTVLKGIGYSYTTDVNTEDPSELLKEASRSGKEMLQVTLEDVRKILRSNTRFQQVKLSQVPKTSRTSLNVPVVQEPATQHKASEKPCRGRRCIAHKNTIDRKLLMAVTHWVGNVMLPYTLNRENLPENQTQADRIKDQLKSVNFISTPVFTLLIQLFQIDAIGCLKVIRERKARRCDLLREFTGNMEPHQVSCRSQDILDCTVQNDSQRLTSASQGSMSETNKTKPGIQRGSQESSAAQPCVRGPALPREKAKTVSELLREKRGETIPKKPTKRSVALTPQVLFIQQPVQQGAQQPAQLSSCHHSVLLPALPPIPGSSMTFLPFQSGQAAAEDPSSSQESGLKSSGNASVNKTLNSSVVAPHQGSTSIQASGGGAVSSPVPNPVSAPGQILLAPTLDVTLPQNIAISGNKAPKAVPLVVPGFSTPVQPQQQNPVNLLPTLLAPQGDLRGASSNMLPITWVLTPQGLIPLSLQTVVGLSSHNGKGATVATSESTSSNDKSSSANLSIVSILPLPAVKTSVSNPDAQSVQAPDKAQLSSLLSQEGSIHACLPLPVTSFSMSTGSGGTIQSVAASSGCVSSLTSIPSSTVNTVASTISLGPSLMSSCPELPSGNPLARDPSKELHCSVSKLSAVPGQNTTQTNCVAQNPHPLPAIHNVSGRAEQPDKTIGTTSQAVPEVVWHPNGPPKPVRNNPEKNPLDLSLVSLEEEESVKEWLKGEQGVQMPRLKNPLPYLPPSVCSLKILARLLLQKKALEERATGFLSLTGENQKRSCQQKLRVVRAMVKQKLEDNPAYVQLKVRFLAAFTLPAFLAALPPPRGKTTVAHCNRSCSSTDDTETEEEPEDAESSSNAVGGKAAEMQLDSTAGDTPAAFSATAAASHEEIVGKDSHSIKAPGCALGTDDNIPLPSRRSARLLKRK